MQQLILKIFKSLGNFSKDQRSVYLGGDICFVRGGDIEDI